MELEANTAARGLGRSVICRVKRPNAILGPYFQNSDQFSMVISPVLVIVHLKRNRNRKLQLVYIRNQTE
jgi:hypothetical protein